MKKEEIIKAIGNIDKMIDKINYLAEKHAKGQLTDLEVKMYRGYSTKYQLWIMGVKIESLSAKEYVKNYPLFESSRGQETI